MTDVNEMFQQYLDSIGTGEESRVRGFLYHACERAAFPVRGKYTASDRVNGDLFDETMEDVFLRVTRPGHAVTIEPSGFTGYFLRALNNGMVDRVRKLKHEVGNVSLESLGGDPTCTVDVDCLQRGDLKRRLLEGLSRVPEVSLRALADRLDGMSYEEIGVAEGIPVGTVKSRLHLVHSKMLPVLSEVGEYGVEEMGGLDITGEDVRGLIERETVRVK